MALKIKNYELPSGELLDEAYLRVQNVLVENKDYEFFEKSDKPDVELELKWITKVECRATVFVWADSMARQYRATALQGFTIEFNYELSQHTNVFEQAYAELSKRYSDIEDC